MTSVFYPIDCHSRDPHSEGGEWFAAVQEHSILFVEVVGSAEERAHRLDELWTSLSAGSGIQGTLDELTHRGLSATEQFALVRWEDEPAHCRVKTIVRGGVTLTMQTMEGESHVDGTGVSTWLEKQFQGVQRVELAVLSAAGGGPSLPLRSGVVNTTTLTVDFETVNALPEPVPESAPQSAPAVQETTASPLTRVPEAPSSSTVNEETVAAGDETAAVDEDDSRDNLVGESVFRTVQDASARDEVGGGAETEREPSGQVDDGDHDGHTVVSSDIAKLRVERQKRPKPQLPVEAVAPGPHLYLELADGSREFLTQPILVGRAPSANKVSAGQLPRLVTVAGPDQDISRNHAQFAVEGGTVVVTDLHSRNGTTVVLPGRSPQQLRQGEPTSVIVGTVIDLGGGVTFTVGDEQ